MASLPAVWLALKAKILADPRTYEHAGVSGLVATVVAQASDVHDALVRSGCERADAVADRLAARHRVDWLALVERHPHSGAAMADAHALSLRHIHELIEAAVAEDGE